MKKIETKKIFRLLYIPCIIFLLAFVLNTNSLLSRKTYILVDDKLISVTYDKNKILRDILKEKNIILNQDDIIYYDLDKPVNPDSRVKIIRVKKIKSKASKQSSFRPIWQKTYTSNLRKVELQKGIVKDTYYNLTQIYYDNKFNNFIYDSEKTISKTFYRLLLLKKNNEIEKIYDLSKTKRIKMIATAYYPGDPLAWGDGTVTCLGQKMQRGIVAVDPKVIPLRTRLYISGYGYGYAGDTGSAIIGNRIDLGVNNKQEEQSWMHREVTVYILEKSKTW
ncbi:MAG: 3D domain-containing protein [Endomicrobiaceae bacterium]|nr:3D domain-containing protein [Endomicrobiaceae bacterium]MDD3053091.1 3D domain-containing protein [Endomicrobiaceae bacterium]MDD3922256.1 3D domain-containing protein [Endomicrobiaceae bacterium]MDD5101411.1 3D domain-containing protein [Endomicrobiaceae bacterium]